MAAAEVCDLDALAALLAGGGWHSHAALCASLGGWSRPRLHAALAGLEALGAPLEESSAAVTLALEDGLDAARIAAAFPGLRTRIRRVCASTNECARAQAGEALCLAEAQIAGRGRRGNVWIQPYGTGLALSLALLVSRPVTGVFAIVAAVAAADELASLGYAGIGLKWPNDLYAGGRKLGGVMAVAEGGPDARVVVGLGLNVHAAPAVPGRATAALCGLGPAPRRTSLAIALTRALLAARSRFAREGFAPFAAAFAGRDVLSGREVDLRTDGATVHGVARGLGPDGSLGVETADGLRRFATGEVSVGAWTGA